MVEFLWTGESAFCRCDHHMEGHETSPPTLTPTESAKMASPDLLLEL